uniref:Uncharacterized protein n=1 Tax=Cucumis melo TaxID=3656 RepID=A0A9I9EDD8_CUCME
MKSIKHNLPKGYLKFFYNWRGFDMIFPFLKVTIVPFQIQMLQHLCSHEIEQRNQAKRVQFEFHKGVINHAYMRIDGEPWKQPLSVEDDKTNLPCRAKSVHDLSSTHSHSSKDYVNEDDEFTEEYEAVQKFGATSTFKYFDVADTETIVLLDNYVSEYVKQGRDRQRLIYQQAVNDIELEEASQSCKRVQDQNESPRKIQKLVVDFVESKYDPNQHQEKTP